MEGKHTPGPWTYEYGAAYHAEKGRLILADRDNDNTAPTERDANVRLCAAAPDLLAMARFFQFLLPEMKRHINSINWDEVEKKLNAAITKAQGQEVGR